MTRILIFLLWVVLIAGTLTVLMTFDSRISGEAFGLRFDSPSWLILGALGFAFFITIYATHKIKDIMMLPAKIRARDARTKRDRGVAALTRGLEAVAVGDAADASHHARVAQKHLENLALTRLLSAQAAQLSGDEAGATQSFSAMLDAPETEFLGLKGLYAQAMKRGEPDKAREHAERAFSLRANAGWAFQSVVDLGLARGAWGDTRAAIAKGKRNKLIEADKADRATAALYAADADAAHLSGDKSLALAEAEAALKLAPSFTPAAIFAASCANEDGKTGKAASIIETAFAKDAHPALIRLYDKLYADEPAQKRSEKLKKLASKNPRAHEAALLEARAANLVGAYESAIAKLEPLIVSEPNAHAYALIATAATQLHGEEAGRGWLERAAAAPRDPRPGAEGTFHFTRDGWAKLVREYMEHGRLGPPPLENAGEAISAEELRLLTAPPGVASDIEPEGAQDDTGPAAEMAGVINGPAPIDADAPQAPPESDDNDEPRIENDEDGERASAAARLTP